MNRSHADFFDARSSLKSIFAKLSFPLAYPQPSDFVAALDQWLETWSLPSAATKLTTNQQIAMLGTNLLTKSYLFCLCVFFFFNNH